ncbi:MAG: guanylate kinase [Acutalibacter muris]|jgi:guanylate kinase|uniref:guanylate kinase n=1 Tax=Acutalibacter muris TaxID=1796620 RepID=UPI0025B774D0|nr:guanylate kinase [Acutalibacter muris]MCI9192397.1 guanylate kinase [Acutalibacter muris]MCI9544372.1 guanylate kinase [Acutalibacter muris]
MSRGILLVVSAPSAGGKGTILGELFKRDGNLRMSVSATTRRPREGEEHGKHYYFISREEFRGLIDSGSMLEYAEYVGNLYGTPRGPVEQWLSEGHDVVLEIEVQGGAQIKKLAPDCVSVFITPPSMEVLEKRLRGRGTENEETIRKRLETARRELPQAENYDYVVINDRLEDAVDDMQAILRSEKLRYMRDPDFIKGLLAGPKA